MDGTLVTQPKYAFWLEGYEWGVENHGVDPDVEVLQRPRLRGRGGTPNWTRPSDSLWRVWRAVRRKRRRLCRPLKGRGAVSIRGSAAWARPATNHPHPTTIRWPTKTTFGQPPEGRWQGNPQDDCLFCKIVAGTIPATIVRQTDTTVAFRDINPQAPTHVLIIPKAHYKNAAALAEADPALTADVLREAQAVADEEKLDGYRPRVQHRQRRRPDGLARARPRARRRDGLDDWPPG
ncbi:hypothetical protein SVIOM74S_01471 [Streptomyces violarus]